MWSISSVRSVAEEVLGLWWSCHSAPSNCHDRVVEAIAFCLGSSSQDRTFVLYFGAGLAALLLVVAFAAGRLTADRALPWRRHRSQRIVRVRRPPLSRFGSDASSASSGHS